MLRGTTYVQSEQQLQHRCAENGSRGGRPAAQHHHCPPRPSRCQGRSLHVCCSTCSRLLLLMFTHGVSKHTFSAWKLQCVAPCFVMATCASAWINSHLCNKTNAQHPLQTSRLACACMAGLIMFEACSTLAGIHWSSRRSNWEVRKVPAAGQMARGGPLTAVLCICSAWELACKLHARKLGSIQAPRQGPTQGPSQAPSQAPRQAPRQAPSPSPNLLSSSR